jgi:hypothetical protein
VQVRKVLGYPPGVELDFAFKSQVNGCTVRLEGLDAFDSAMHCAQLHRRSTDMQCCDALLPDTAAVPGAHACDARCHADDNAVTS